MLKKQFEARYVLLDGSPRSLYPIYAETKEKALEQAFNFVKNTVSKNYDPRNIKIKQA